MIITNNHNLPDNIYSLICEEQYDSDNPSDFSATTLLRSPRQHYLTVRHYDDLCEDAMNRVWILFGNAIHNMIDTHSNGKVDMNEERLYVNVLDKVISGKVDCYHDGIITDYKVTSAYSVSKPDKIDEWTKQLNIYAYILEKNGHKVTQLRIIAFLRDWSKARSNDYNYPSTNVMEIPIQLWTQQEREDYISKRVRLFVANELLDDSDLTTCPLEFCCFGDSQDTYAVYEKGKANRAKKLFKDITEARQFASSIGGYVKHRPAERARCESYCSVSQFCNQFKEYKDASNRKV